ncbi:hypothetical protein NC652_011492 [Populus alba x Populus x berolinensis]|nr:hypothetical protein NC652_011492 [Populus alba x Populus x berolinensis]
MPDSPFTRMLRTKGRFPAWYTPALTMEQIDEQAASCHKLCRFFVKLVEMDVVVLMKFLRPRKSAGNIQRLQVLIIILSVHNDHLIFARGISAANLWKSGRQGAAHLQNSSCNTFDANYKVSTLPFLVLLC